MQKCLILIIRNWTTYKCVIQTLEHSRPFIALGRIIRVVEPSLFRDFCEFYEFNLIKFN